MNGYKTYIFGVISILFAIFGLVLGHTDPAEAFNIIQVAMASMFIRNGLARK